MHAGQSSVSCYMWAALWRAEQVVGCLVELDTCQEKTHESVHVCMHSWPFISSSAIYQQCDLLYTQAIWNMHNTTGENHFTLASEKVQNNDLVRPVCMFNTKCDHIDGRCKCQLDHGFMTLQRKTIKTLNRWRNGDGSVLMVESWLPLYYNQSSCKTNSHSWFQCTKAW